MTRWRSQGLLGALALLGGLVFLSCSSGRAGGEGEETSGPMPAGHFGELGVMRLAVVRADLDVFRRWSRRLQGEAAGARSPEGAEGYLARIHDLADAGSGVGEVGQAAAITARLAANCGACHQRLGAEVERGIREDTTEAPSSATGMSRHLWAADRMWTGLLAPDEGTWRAGASSLASAPLVPARVAPAAAATVTELAGRLHGMAVAADTATDTAVRTALYGELLATCARCHRAVSAGD